jgi:hypothetical protein
MHITVRSPSEEVELLTCNLTLTSCTENVPNNLHDTYPAKPKPKPDEKNEKRSLIKQCEENVTFALPVTRYPYHCCGVFCRLLRKQRTEDAVPCCC